MGILISFITSSNHTVSFLIEICSKIIESIGISILIANIFSFTIGTEQFLDYIRDRLVKVVISKEFITRLSPDEQRSMLRMVLKPSKELSEIYSGINDYFNQYIEQSMRLFNNCYRGHMHLDATASFNKEKGVVQIEYDVDNVVYKLAEEFDPITVKFEDDSCEHIRTIIRGQDGEWEEISEDSVSAMDQLNDPSMVKGYSIPVPQKFNDLDQVSISMRLVEYGNDHWQIFSFKTLKPCDQLSITLRCEEDLVIKNVNTYGVQKNFAIEKNDKKIKVTFNDWLSPGFGVNIMVAKENHHS